MRSDGHYRAERRSLAYHREIALRLRHEPELLGRARARVAGWLRDGGVHRTWAERWRDLLNQSTTEIVARLGADDEDAVAMRQVSPFACVLTPRERWQIWRATGGDAAAPTDCA